MTSPAIVPKSLNPLHRQTWVYGWYKIQGCRYQAADHVNAKAGWIARQIRWPLGMGIPGRWPELHVMRISALGDMLMSTPALRLLKQIRPEIRIVFYTHEQFIGAVRGLPFLDEVRPHVEFPRPSALWSNGRRSKVTYKDVAYGYRHRAVELYYEGSYRPRRHIARIFGDQLGLSVNDVSPSCVFNEAMIREYQDAWALLPRPWIVVNRRASSWTPNKDWQGIHWERLITRLLDRYTIVEIGEGNPRGTASRHPHYVDLTGKLALDRFLAIVAAADLHVGPVSGPVHVAAAAGKPSVVIYGGYEHPDCSGYPGNVSLYTPLPCAPCWLRDPCPYDRLCLSKISPEQVERAIDALRCASPAAGRISPEESARESSHIVPSPDVQSFPGTTQFVAEDSSPIIR